MNYYVYIVLLIGSLVSCSESSRHFPRYEDFPDEKALNAQVIHLDTALFRYHRLVPLSFPGSGQGWYRYYHGLAQRRLFLPCLLLPRMGIYDIVWQTRRGTRRNGIGRLLPVYLQGFYLDARCEQNANNPVED